MAEPQQQDEKRQIIEKIKASDNILVALNNSPSVDELAAALGVVLIINKMNKMDKHATAIVSGEIPDALQFLDPEKTFENTVDGLRDFIVAIDKDKADHIRVKAEGDFAKVYITPYRTTISKDDLEFSQGDYNVDLVVALNVQTTDDLDNALSAHGRILHDATVVDITTNESSRLGSISWRDSTASSLSEMVTILSSGLKDEKGKSFIDQSVATALLTGIVAATDRFSNNKTTPNVMAIASKLMTYGADQQLIATNLQKLNQDNPTKSDDTIDEFSIDTEVDNEPVAEENTSSSEDNLEQNDKKHLSIDHGKSESDEPQKEETPDGVVPDEPEQTEFSRKDEDIETRIEELEALAEPDGPIEQPPEHDDTQETKGEVAPLDFVPSIPEDIVSPDAGNSPTPATDLNVVPPEAPSFSPPTPATPVGMAGAVSSDVWQDPSVDQNMSPVAFDSSHIQQPDFFGNGVENAAPAAPLPPADIAPVVPTIPQLPSIDTQAVPQAPPSAPPAAPPVFSNPTDIQLPPLPDFTTTDNGLPMPPEVPSFGTLPEIPVLDSLPTVSAQSVPEGSVFANNTPVMQDQVYPQPTPQSTDPSEFRIPGM
jgi:Exopolyphosphatase-related proteins